MGAGDFHAGFGPAGSDPVVSTGPAVLKAFSVPKFDPALKDFPMRADGQYEAVHPVDQAVALALGIQANKITSDPALGNTLKAIEKIDAKLAAQVNTRVHNALKTLLNAGDIEIGTITVEPASFGGFACAVPYRNLRVLTDQQRIARVPLT